MDPFQLAYPVEMKDKDGNVLNTLTELALRRFNGADVAAVGNANAKGPGEALKVMVCRMCSIPPATFDKLDGEDVTALGELAASFLERSRPTGG